MHKTSRMRFAFFCSDNRKSKIQNRKLVGIVALAVAFAMCGAVAAAQQPKKVSRIGYLTADSRSGSAEVRGVAFRQGLRELGYVEGKNIVIEWRSAEGKIDRLPALAAELVRLELDVIVTGGPTATRPVKQATTTIPIVMTQDSDPVGNGFVASLARPGGNITGLSNLAQEISGKRLEILKEIVPKLSRVAVLGMSNNPGNAQSLRETELAAERARRADSIFGHTRFKGYRGCITNREQAASGCSPRVELPRQLFPRDSGPRGKEPAAGDLLQFDNCRQRGVYELRRKHHRSWTGAPQRMWTGF